MTHAHGNEDDMKETIKEAVKIKDPEIKGFISPDLNAAVRTKPSKDSEIIGVLLSGQEVTIISTNNIWSKVEYSNEKIMNNKINIGFVLTRLIEMK